MCVYVCVCVCACVSMSVCVVCVCVDVAGAGVVSFDGGHQFQSPERNHSTGEIMTSERDGKGGEAVSMIFVFAISSLTSTWMRPPTTLTAWNSNCTTLDLEEALQWRLVWYAVGNRSRLDAINLV